MSNRFGYDRRPHDRAHPDRDHHFVSPARFWCAVPDAPRFRAVERCEVDRQALGHEVRDQAQHLRNGILLRGVRSAREVWSSAEDRADHARTRVPGADFDERPGAVVVRRLDHTRHVDHTDQPGRDRISTRPFARLVAAPARAAVDRHILWRDGQHVQFVVRPLDRSTGFAVSERHPFEQQHRFAEIHGELFHVGAQPPDHTLVRRIHDQQVRTRLGP